MNVSGVNPRTAIGQRSDGAILMLVIDGRQVISLGATMEDLVDIMMEYGAVNACNLDGGSSSLMWFEGEYVNNCASVIGIRPVPTTFLVLKEGVKDNG
jgi:exopolysaccharide biosynthesis protein